MRRTAPRSQGSTSRAHVRHRGGMRAHGFSLVEAMVAATILAVGLLSLTAATRAVQRMDRLARRTAEAAEAAAGRLAQLRSTCAAGSGSDSGLVLLQWSVTASPPRYDALVRVAFVH